MSAHPAAAVPMLVPFAPEHMDILLQWADSPAVLFDWIGSRAKWPLTREQIEALHAPARLDPPDLYVYTALDPADGTPVGHAELALNRRNALARVERVLLAPAARGRGLGVGMIRAVVREAFDRLPLRHAHNQPLHRLELSVFAHNAAALRCYAAAGFLHEGVHREARPGPDGARHDLVSMALLRSDRKSAE